VINITLRCCTHLINGKEVFGKDCYYSKKKQNKISVTDSKSRFQQNCVDSALVLRKKSCNAENRYVQKRYAYIASNMQYNRKSVFFHK